MGIDALFTVLCASPVDSAEAEKRWFDEVYGIVSGAIDPIDDLATNSAAAKAALTAAGYSDEVVNALSTKETAVTDALTFVEAVISCSMPDTYAVASAANPALEGCAVDPDSNGQATTGFSAGTGPAHYVAAGGDGSLTSHLNTLYGWRHGKAHETFLDLAPAVSQIADESDESFTAVKDAVVAKMNEIRKAQLQNDADKKTIAYVRDVSECNEAYHEQVYGEHTAIDESELCKRYDVGSAMLTDLDNMYRENCVSKQSFFKDITFKGCC
jgi:hypothetical protein